MPFAFPKDLNGQEHATFHRRLGQRHQGVKVDYWAKSSLDVRLDTAEGRRIAANVFEEHDAIALAERLLKAGSPLQSAADFLAAESAISEGLAKSTLDYDWAIHRGARRRLRAAEDARSAAAVVIRARRPRDSR